jgi:hypothetical protein
MAAVPLSGGTRRALAAHRTELRKAFVIGVCLLDLFAIIDAALRRNWQSRKHKQPKETGDTKHIHPLKVAFVF